MPETSNEYTSNNEKSDGTIDPTSDTVHRVGMFGHHRDGDRWQWSDAVARMHG